MRPYFFNHLIFFLFDEFDSFLNIQNLFLDYLKKIFIIVFSKNKI